MDFIQATNITPAQRTTARLIVLHTMEAPEKPGTALAVAKWFAKPKPKPGEEWDAKKHAPKASAHFCVDDQVTVQCVRLHDVAWGAPGANADGVHIEHAGYAAQSPEQWRDDYSRLVLGRSSFLAASLCARFGIQARRLTVEEVRGKTLSGICGHRDVTRAFRLSDHVDPGDRFPWDDYVALVEDALNGHPVPLESETDQ